MTQLSRFATALAAVLCVVPPLAAHEGDPKLRDRQPSYVGPGWRNAQRRGSDGNLVESGSTVQFPKSNVTLLPWLSLDDFDQPASGNGNSCFGYTSPSGREYAIIGVSNGTAFVEITQPGNPVLVAKIAGPTSLWRDVRTFSTYAYAVSEGGGGARLAQFIARWGELREFGQCDDGQPAPRRDHLVVAARLWSRGPRLGQPLASRAPPRP